MKFNPEKHRRHSVRLKGYDYAQPGAYFLTICTQDRACLFGDVVDGEMRLNDIGQMVQRVWNPLPDRFPGVETDAFVMMPNHIHGIIVFVGAPLVGALNGAETGAETRAATRAAPTTPTVGDVVGAFKSLTTVEYIRGMKTTGWPPFPGQLWQRNYYEHIIRSEDELNSIREYIALNPIQWMEDENNPKNRASMA